MEDGQLLKAKQALAEYLEENKCRKTPERFAILDAVYQFDGHFTLEELGDVMEKNNFRVSRATLYNTINLFLKLRLVVKHAFQKKTVYEACLYNDSHSHKICTVCGKVGEVHDAMLDDVIENLKLKRFHQKGYSLYIYGICSTCLAKMTRKRGKRLKK